MFRAGEASPDGRRQPPGRPARRARARRFAAPLERAADAYVVRRGSGKTIVAGYPWFTDWGRDTFIALRGFLTLPGRLGAGRARSCSPGPARSREGMLPNRFPDAGEMPEFNAVDASLWYVIAVHDFLALRSRPIDATRGRDRCSTPSGRSSRAIATAPATASGWTRTACSRPACPACS